jgi:Flp pilus assembly protein TadG
MRYPLAAGCAGRRAAAAVECCLVVPFLAVLVTGIVEVSRSITARQVLNDAVRKGCRTGILPNRANSDITSDLNNILSDNNIDSSIATITIQVNGKTVDASTAVAGDEISVQVSIPFSKVSWGFAKYLSGNATLSSSLAMERQG